MSQPKPGQVFCLKVRSSFPHYSNRTREKRFIGLPSLQIRLSARPNDSSSGYGFLRWLSPGQSPSRAPLVHLPVIDAIVDTGASRCVISSSDAYDTFSSLRGRDLKDLKEKSITLPNGMPMKGQELMMEMQVVGIQGTWVVPFLVSDRLHTPVLLSWKQLRRLLPPVWWIDGTSLLLGDLVKR